MEEKHYDFFQNKLCEFYPCHPGADPETFSCLFCYCPLYALGDPVRGELPLYGKRGQGLYPLPPAPCPGELWEDFGEDAGDFGASEEKKGGSLSIIAAFHMKWGLLQRWQARIRCYSLL